MPNKATNEHKRTKISLERILNQDLKFENIEDIYKFDDSTEKSFYVKFKHSETLYSLVTGNPSTEVDITQFKWLAKKYETVKEIPASFSKVFYNKFKFWVDCEGKEGFLIFCYGDFAFVIAKVFKIPDSSLEPIEMWRTQS